MLRTLMRGGKDCVVFPPKQGEHHRPPRRPAERPFGGGRENSKKTPRKKKGKPHPPPPHAGGGGRGRPGGGLAFVLVAIAAFGGVWPADSPALWIGVAAAVAVWLTGLYWRGDAPDARDRESERERRGF